MQEPTQLAREIYEVEHEKLSREAAEKVARIRELTGLTDAEVRALAVSRSLDSSFALSALASTTLH